MGARSALSSAGTAKRLEALPGASGEPGPFDGQLDIHLPESTYLADGEFTTSDMLTFWTENMIKAEIEGYSFYRLVGEMTWALRNVPGVEHLVGYESELNRVTSSYPVISGSGFTAQSGSLGVSGYVSAAIILYAISTAERGTVSTRRVVYDVRTAASKILDGGLPRFLADRLGWGS